MLKSKLIVKLCELNVPRPKCMYSELLLNKDVVHKTGAIEETKPNARTCGLNMAISILFSLKNGNFGPFVSQKTNPLHKT